jgi:nucleoside-diphosphate-sugar epimerase
VIHLAALANDPSAELNPDLTREINYEAVLSLVDEAKRAGAERFVNASTATVYGVRDEPDVDETVDHRPITLYGRYKSETDKFVSEACDGRFTTVNLRAATVCGWSPRMRLDLTVNILTYLAVVKEQIRVFGGQQMRPNIVLDDLVDAYVLALESPAAKVNGQAFNIGAENARVLQIAQIVRDAANPDAQIVIEKKHDHRSYHVCTEKARRVLGFQPRLGIAHGCLQVKSRLLDGSIPNPEGTIYRNVEHIKSVGLPPGIPLRSRLGQ